MEQYQIHEVGMAAIHAYQQQEMRNGNYLSAAMIGQSVADAYTVAVKVAAKIKIEHIPNQEVAG